MRSKMYSHNDALLRGQVQVLEKVPHAALIQRIFWLHSITLLAVASMKTALLCNDSWRRVSQDGLGKSFQSGMMMDRQA